MPENTVYVGRGSKWGNPFKVGDNIPRLNVIFKDAKHAVEWYQKCQPFPMLELHELKGKNLACWCKLSEPCHADILLKLANCGHRKEGG